MTLRAWQACLSANLAAALAALVSSCALLPQAQVERLQESQPVEHISPRQIVQLGFGRDAVFAACIEPACPSVTRKTLETAQPLAMSSATVAVDSSVAKTATTIHSLGIKPAIEPATADAVPSGKQPLPLVLYFPLGGAALTPADKAALDELLPYASKAHRVVIAGRTDNAGSDAANQTVALARANSVRDYLRTRLSAPDEVFVIDAQGSCCYVASNDSPEGRKQNRRVEIVLSVSGQVAP